MQKYEIYLSFVNFLQLFNLRRDSQWRNGGFDNP